MASINDLAAAAIASSAAARQAGGRGALIVLEGVDRSGKTTQVKLLEQRFVELGRKVKMMRFPGESCLAARTGTCHPPTSSPNSPISKGMWIFAGDSLTFRARLGPGNRR